MLSSRRNVELWLTLLAAAVVAGAYTLVALGRTASLPADIVPWLIQVLALLLMAHLAVRFLARGADGVMLPIALLLNGIGYVFIARTRPSLAGLQATWTLIGIIAFAITLFVLRKGANDLARYKWTFVFGGVGLLLLPFVPHVGRLINGSRIWVKIGPINFQPGEFAKIALAIFFAAYFVERRELLAVGTWKVGPFHLPEARHLAPVVVAWLVSLVVMIGQRDLGSSLLFFALFVVLVWVVTGRASYLVICAVLFALGSVGAYHQFSHVHERVAIWTNPWADPAHTGYQIIQGTYALAAGGTTGTGLGLGDPTRIPAVHNDFIFAAIGEELGLVGTTAILIAFLLMIGGGLRIAARAERPFEKALAAGLTTIVGVQAFVIIGGVIRVVPLTGVTLPFVSYGGSSLLANYVLLAILLRISDTSAQRLGEVPARRRRRAKQDAPA
jgi:cell division protein FtsW (lipid II flippase)